MARSDMQTVRTTAYTHSEADHLVYGARNALGGRLQSASIPRGRAEVAPRALPVTDATPTSETMTVAFLSRSKHAAGRTNRRTKTSRRSRSREPQIGSAAADWSRWPLGTTFQVLSTGQIYKIDDYGWALAGRNTIDLYMGTRSDMNRWGVRREPIKILRWGDAEQSIKILEPRQTHKHIRRMVLELRGQDSEAAALN
jgi:3D (Asp-Asp-Asp) domain-containing protein